MVCSDCQTRGRWGRRAVSKGDRALARLFALSCASCGRLLAAPDSTDRLLGVLAALSRFGMAPEGRPVLAESRSIRGRRG